ncbi:hypothetical protein BC938DRAFT_478773 [Jimgerdemannia flammicorona]|uniref:Uncharacterized protein n=1 Tax=Jimgerdemannia flammicorona TaxID=994334 RepID=A0A433QMC0_9FUNG|nr:hypothetical protein BC938DRAFT_478773 [Jimgerdemannia flammicorona]
MNMTSENIKAERHNSNGNEAFKAGDYHTAYKHFSKAIKEANPKCAKYYTNRARTSLSLKRYAVAYDDAEEAIKHDPANVKGYYCKGEALFGKRDYQLAQNQSEKALELAPHDATIRLKVDECKKLQFDRNVHHDEVQQAFAANSSREHKAAPR